VLGRSCGCGLGNTRASKCSWRTERTLRDDAPERQAASAAAIAAAVIAAGGGGGRRRSDLRLKHDLVLLGRLDDGLGYYRFVYKGGHTAYVGVMAQEVETVMPKAVSVGADGYLRVSYDMLGLPFETYAQWLADGAHLPSMTPVAR
jgi:hypothetical protein